MSDVITSWIRTAVPGAVGSALAWVVVTLGINPADLPDVARNGIMAGSAALVIGLYYAGARWVERRVPWLGRFLLGSGKTPTYNGTAATGETVKVYPGGYTAGDPLKSVSLYELQPGERVTPAPKPEGE